MTTLLTQSSRIYLAGHTGLVGSALYRRMEAEGFSAILTTSFPGLDLRDQAAVKSWFDKNRPELVIMSAGTVGGIWANSQRPAEFLYDNLLMAANVINAAHLTQVKKLLYLGSSCIYPRECPQPIKEEYLLTGPLETTNEGYALAKIAGIKLCQTYRKQYGDKFISAMPTNLYGPGDNFDLNSSHVIPALIRKFEEAKVTRAKTVTIWGTGEPRREFLHVDDLADACLFLLEHYDESITINVGTGEDLTIKELADLIRQIVYPTVHLSFDTTKPDGTPQKLLDVSRIHALGWRAKKGLRQGLASTYQWYQLNSSKGGIP
jgi:GDP-L-fucose synthase